MLAASLGVIFCIAAFAIDLGNAYVLRGQLQSTADAAALAGVSQLPDETAADAEAMQYVALNMPSAQHGTVLASSDVVAGNWDGGTRTFTPAGTPLNALRVTAKRSQDNGNAAPTYLAGLLGFNSVDIQVSAVATFGSQICILALEPTDPQAFEIGNRTFTANNCSIHVNSSNSVDALSGNSNGTIIADSICVVGGYDPDPTYSPMPETGCAPIPDPLASLAAPTIGACTVTDYALSSGSDTLNPGVYCNGMAVNTNGTLTLNPGTYIVKDGAFDVGGGASIVGDGVTIYLTGTGAQLDFSGGGLLDLSAPTTGAFSGILIYADRNMDPSVVHSLKGGTGSIYQGVVYMPSTGLLFAGAATGTSTSSWASYIARTFTSSGSGELVVNLISGSSSVPLPAALGGTAKLVQ